jgi:hypothetical protein
MTIPHHITQNSPDDHAFIVIECPGRPAISIDVMNHAGRRGVGIRVDGMGIFHALVDLKELKPKGEALFRFCGMCGEKIQLHSSRTHKCGPDEGIKERDI